MDWVSYKILWGKGFELGLKDVDILERQRLICLCVYLILLDIVGGVGIE